MRALAAVLAAALLLSLLSGLWIRVSISQNAGNAAETYLAGETEYVNASGFERFVEQLRSLRRPADLEDYYRRRARASRWRIMRRRWPTSTSASRSTPPIMARSSTPTC